MVFFTCNACGQSIKKNKVEKHYQNECPRCEVLSCLDCGKEFYGDAYATHTSCMSEAEKYQGALYQDSKKGQTPKGERKQQEWLDKIRSLDGAKCSSRVSSLLDKMAGYSNIPRKKKKFENFVRNCLKVSDHRTIEELWNIFSSEPKTGSEGNGQLSRDTAVGAMNEGDKSETSISTRVAGATEGTKEGLSKDEGSALKAKESKEKGEQEMQGEGEKGDTSKKKKKKKQSKKEEEKDSEVKNSREDCISREVKLEVCLEEVEALQKENGDCASMEDSAKEKKKEKKKKKQKHSADGDSELEGGRMDAEEAKEIKRKSKKRKNRDENCDDEDGAVTKKKKR